MLETLSPISANFEAIEAEFESKLEQFVMGINRNTEDLQQASFLVRASGYENKLPNIFSRKVCALASQLGEKKLTNAKEIILQFLRNVIISSTYIPRMEHAALGYLKTCVESLGNYVRSAKEAIVQLLVDVLLGVYKLPGKQPHDLMISGISHKIAWGIIGAISMISFETDDDMLALANGIRLSLQLYRRNSPLTKTQLNQLVMLFHVSIEIENLFKIQSNCYYSPTIFSQVYSDILFSTQKDALARLVKEDITAIQGYVELLVIPSDNIAHLVHLCREICLTSVTDDELPNLLRDQENNRELDSTSASSLHVFCKQVIFAGSQMGKDILENIRFIANKQISKGPLYEFLCPLTELHSILPLLFQGYSPTFLVNMIEISLSLAYNHILHVLNNQLLDKHAVDSAETLAGQLIGILVQATIQLKGSFIIEFSDVKQLTERCLLRVGKVLAIIFERYQQNEAFNTPPREYVDCSLASVIAFVLGTEIDLMESIKLLCKANMLAVDRLGQCIQDMRLCYRTMIDDETTDSVSLSLVCSYLTLVKIKNESNTQTFPLICYNKIMSNPLINVDSRYVARINDIFRGRNVFIDTGSMIVFEYSLGSFRINISTYTIVLLLLLFCQSDEFKQPLRFNKFISQFFTTFAIENTPGSRLLVTMLTLGLIFDVPFMCLSKTGHSVSDGQVDYTDGFITSFTDISELLNCGSIAEIRLKGDSVDRLAGLFVYANPYAGEVIKILIEQGFDLFDPERQTVNIHFPEYISQQPPDISPQHQNYQNNSSTHTDDTHAPHARRYISQHHLSLKAAVVQYIKRSKSSLLEIHSEISKKWLIELDTLKIILGELVDTGVIELDEQGLYIYDL